MWVIKLGHVTILQNIRESDSIISALSIFVELITFMLSCVKKTSSKNAHGLLSGDSQIFFHSSRVETECLSPGTFLASKFNGY